MDEKTYNLYMFLCKSDQDPCITVGPLIAETPKNAQLQPEKTQLEKEK